MTTKAELFADYLYRLNKTYFPGEKIKFVINEILSINGYYIEGYNENGIAVLSIAADGRVWFMNRMVNPIQIRYIEKIDWDDYA